MIAIGLMSGTSLDGIDAARVRIEPRGRGYSVELQHFETHPFEPHVAALLHEALPPHQGTIAQAARLHRELGNAFADAALSAAQGAHVNYAASHGQTVWHDGGAHVTLQLADPFAIRDALHATVCFDFRSADCAAGGHGAPLVPYADALLLGSDDEDRVAVNIGGIANLTVLPRGCDAANVLAFDSGPGNMLIDAFVRERTGGAQRYDVNGDLASRGAANDAALQALRQDPYFGQPAPKTTGREHFGAQFLRAHDSYLRPLGLEDGAATLAALTAATLAAAIRDAAPAGARVLLSGGGRHNKAIVRGLRERLAEYCVEDSGMYGLDGDAKEAIAFAVLGYETLRGRAANVPRATGATRPALLGAIAPFELNALLRAMEAEWRA